MKKLGLLFLLFIAGCDEEDHVDGVIKSINSCKYYAISHSISYLCEATVIVSGNPEVWMVIDGLKSGDKISRFCRLSKTKSGRVVKNCLLGS